MFEVLGSQNCITVGVLFQDIFRYLKNRQFLTLKGPHLRKWWPKAAPRVPKGPKMEPKLEPKALKMEVLEKLCPMGLQGCPGAF